MDQFFLDLRPAIVEAVRTEMEKIRQEAEDERFYAAALVTDSDCVTLFLAVNTEEALAWRDRKDRTAKRLDTLRQYWDGALVDQVANGSFSLNRFVPDEWGYSDSKGSGLNQVSKLLFDKEAHLSDGLPGMDCGEYDEVHQRFQDQFLETVALAFEDLRREGVFGPEVTCLISMSDDEYAAELEDASIRRLNTPAQYQEYVQWTKFFNG